MGCNDREFGASQTICKTTKTAQFPQNIPLYPLNAQLLSYLRTDCFTWQKNCNSNCTHNSSTSCSCNCNCNSNMFNAQAQKWLNSKRTRRRCRRRRRRWRIEGGRMRRSRAREDLIRDIAEGEEELKRKRYRWKKSFPCSLFPTPSHPHISFYLYLPHTYTRPLHL